MFNSLSTSVYNTHTKLLALSLVRVFVFFLFVCMCVCVLFFFTVPQWEDRKFNFFDIIIFAFLETQSPSGSPPPSKYTSVPMSCSSGSISPACYSNNVDIPGILSPRSPHLQV